MTPSLMAMGVAIFAVVNIVIAIGALSLLFGAFETLFGKPKLTLLRPVKGGNFFAFGFVWNSAKEPAKIDLIKLRLFNPFGSPTQVDISRQFDIQKSSFALELDFGHELINLLGAKGFDQAVMQVEVSSSQDGVAFQFDLKGPKFKQMVMKSNQTLDAFIKAHKIGQAVKPAAKPPIDVPIRSFIADTVPGKGPQLKLATNPVFAAEFAGAQAGGGAGSTADTVTVANFSILKVWIEPGCIVCNACEDIYPEVFDVQADTCLIRPNPPLDDGLKIQESAEACPVEVIKFTRAS